MVIPYDLDLTDLAERAGLDEIADCDLIWFAAVLSAYLHDAVMLDHLIASGFSLLQIIGHRFFAVAILACLNHELQMSRVLEISGRDQHSIYVFERKQVFHVLEGAGRSSIIFSCLRRRRF